MSPASSAGIALICLLLAASTSAQSPPPLLWTFTPSGSYMQPATFASPYVLPVELRAPSSSYNQLIGLDVASGKQLWAIQTSALSACPSSQGCFIYPADIQYDNSTDLLFVALSAPSAPTLSVVAITSATGAIAYSVSIPVDPNAPSEYSYSLALGIPGQLYVWDSHLGTLYAFNISTGELRWSSNATNQTLCRDAITDISGVVSGPRGVTITYCGLYSYWAWDSLGEIMWTNNGALGSTDIWNYGPTFLADGSFLIWKQTSPASLPCRYSMSSKSYALSWCAKQPTSPYVWAEAPFVALPSSVATLVVDAKHSSREFVVGVGSFSTQGGALGWIGTPVANYTGDNEPMAYSPAADPTGNTLYYAPADKASLLYVMSAADGTVLTTYKLADESTTVLFVTANAAYLASDSSIYAVKLQ